jgi:hypothetical protein
MTLEDDLLNNYKPLEDVSDEVITQLYIEGNMSQASIDEFLRYREENPTDFEVIYLNEKYLQLPTDSNDYAIRLFAQKAMNINCMYVVSLVEQVLQESEKGISIEISGIGLILK